MPDIARAEVGRLHFYGYRRFFALVFGIRAIGRFQRLFKHCCHFARDAEYALAIGAIGGDGNIENPVVQPDDFANILSDGRAFVQNEQAVHIRAGIKVVVDAELLARAEHAEGLHAAQLALLNFFDARRIFFECRGIGLRHGGIVERDGRLHAREYIGRARDDLDFPTVFLAAVYDADLHMVAVGMRDDGFYLSHDHAVYFFAEIRELLYLEPAGKELLGELLRGNVYIDIIFQPA